MSCAGTSTGEASTSQSAAPGALLAGPAQDQILGAMPSLPSGSGGGTQRVLSYLQHWLEADGLCARGALCVAWPGYITCARYSSSDESSTSVSSGFCAVSASLSVRATSSSRSSSCSCVHPAGAQQKRTRVQLPPGVLFQLRQIGGTCDGRPTDAQLQAAATGHVIATAKLRTSYEGLIRRAKTAKTARTAPAAQTASKLSTITVQAINAFCSAKPLERNNAVQKAGLKEFLETKIADCIDRGMDVFIARSKVLCAALSAVNSALHDSSQAGMTTATLRTLLWEINAEGVPLTSTELGTIRRQEQAVARAAEIEVKAVDSVMWAELEVWDIQARLVEVCDTEVTPDFEKLLPPFQESLRGLWDELTDVQWRVLIVVSPTVRERKVAITTLVTELRDVIRTESCGDAYTSVPLALRSVGNPTLRNIETGVDMGSLGDNVSTNQRAQASPQSLESRRAALKLRSLVQYTADTPTGAVAVLFHVSTPVGGGTSIGTVSLGGGMQLSTETLASLMRDCSLEASSTNVTLGYVVPGQPLQRRQLTTRSSADARQADMDELLTLSRAAQEAATAVTRKLEAFQGQAGGGG
jgi:hypothetical protein